MPEWLGIPISILLGGLVLIHGCLLGRLIFPHVNRYASILPGVVLCIALQSLLQTLGYYANFSLGIMSDAASLIISIGLIRLFHRVVASKEKTVKNPRPSKGMKEASVGCSKLLPLALSILLFAFVIHTALRGSTMESIRTPWPLLSPWTLPVIASLWFLLFYSIRRHAASWLAMLQTVLTLGATTLFTPLIYRIGFGFDGFLHIASEKILLATGTLHPKPLYYIGQYVFTTWLSRLSHLPLELIDRWLVPISSAILLPLFLYLSLPRDRRWLSAFSVFLFLPLADFIATTPQSFAYVLGLSALLLLWGTKHTSIHPLAPLLLGAWAIAVHPLAGLPLFFVILALSPLLPASGKKKWGAAACTLLASFSIPILFYALSLRHGTPITWNFGSLFQAQPWIDKFRSFIPWVGNHFVLWPAWSELIKRSVPLLLLALTGLGIWHEQKNRDQATNHQLPATLILLAVALFFWSSEVFLKTAGTFTFLIDYERDNYANRLHTLAILCLLPASIPGLELVWKRVAESRSKLVFAVFAFLATMGASLTYQALPHHDALTVSRAWSTSIHDIEAVRLIDKNAGSTPYVVLANQSVSAAAVSELGFKRYAGDVFFYPIPTGGPLYQLYLNLTYQGVDIETIRSASQLGQAKIVYIVINDYWWQADNMSETLKGLTDKEWSIGNGKARIFKFEF